jgi:hypothetical protein
MNNLMDILSEKVGIFEQEEREVIHNYMACFSLQHIYVLLYTACCSNKTGRLFVLVSIIICIIRAKSLSIVIFLLNTFTSTITHLLPVFLLRIHLQQISSISLYYKYRCMFQMLKIMFLLHTAIYKMLARVY